MSALVMLQCSASCQRQWQVWAVLDGSVGLTQCSCCIGSDDREEPILTDAALGTNVRFSTVGPKHAKAKLGFAKDLCHKIFQRYW